MIELLEELLIEKKLIADPGRATFDLIFTTGSCLLFNVFINNEQFYHFKVTEIDDLYPEYQLYQEARKLFGDYTPNIIGFLRKNGWDIVLTEGVHHRVLSPSRLTEDKSNLTQQIIDFLELMTTEGAPHNSQTAHNAFIHELHDHFSSTQFAHVIEPWLNNSVIGSLPHIRQHGDFAVNNVAESGSKLIIFDWEDFGKITLPGFDLCILLASVLRYNDREILEFICHPKSTHPTLARLLDRSEEVAGIASPLFKKLIPLYLTIFLYLKKDYGTSIQKNVGDLISSLDSMEEDAMPGQYRDLSVDSDDLTG